MGQSLSCWTSEREEGLYVQYNPDDKTAVLDILDDPTRDKFKWRVWWVAASGFFTASYCIFSTNVVSPALSFVYPRIGDCSTTSNRAFIINMTTLTGTIVGMVLFGFLADARGRKKLYGLELLIVIIGTIGLVQSSSGYNSMNVYAWIGFWRFIQGVGLGAEYPLSATIAAEWSSTKTRGRMMASVFLMQSVGQISAYAVSIVVVIGLGPRLGLLDHTNQDDPQEVELARRSVDAIWRLILSVGAFPALLAIVLRRLLPETPRFLAEHTSVEKAMETTGKVFNAVPEQHQQLLLPAPRADDGPREGRDLRPQPHHHNYDDDGIYPDPMIRPANFPGNRTPVPSPARPGVGRQHHPHPLTAPNPQPRGVMGAAEPPLSPASPPTNGRTTASSAAAARTDDDDPETGILDDILDYLAAAISHLQQNSRWRAFLGLSFTWYLLDLSVYGLGLDSPRTIATMYLSTPPSTPLTCDSGEWRSDPSQPSISIYDMLIQNTLRNLQTITTGTLPGSIIILFAIDYVPRATWMGWTFAALAGLFAVTGGTLFTAYESDKHAMTLVFYVLTQFLNNLGPNTMTWILPAELFATRYRATFYGIAAAAGKLGAVTIQIINTVAVSGKGKIPFAGMLLGLCPAMLLGAFFSWVWVPEVQKPFRKGRGRRGEGGDEEEERQDAEGGQDHFSSSGSGTGMRSSAEEDEGRGDLGVRRGGGHDTEEDRRVGGSEGGNGGVDGGNRGDSGPRRRHRSLRKVHVRAFFEDLVLPNRTLEDIAEDPARGQMIGIRECVGHAFREGILSCFARRERARGDEEGVVEEHDLREGVGLGRQPARD